MSNPFFDEIKKQYKSGSALIKLIIVNLAIFLAVHVFGSILYLFKVLNGTELLVKWLALPADLSAIVSKPWAIVTYMFLHQDFMHIFFNMLILYFCGRIFVQFLNEKKLVVVYLLGGFAGGLIYILAFNIFPIFNGVLPISIAMGASASVMAVMVAAATYVPNFIVRLVFLGNVKLKYIAMVYVAMDLISIQVENAGGHIAHIGGALFGYFFIVQLKSGKDYTLRFSRFLDRLKGMLKPRKKMKVVYKKQGKTKTDRAYNDQKANNQKKVDLILDKISKSGYDSLSAEEKAILFDASKK